MPEVTIEIRPRKAFREFLESEKRWDCLVVHRRGGKTYGALQKLIKRACSHKRRNMEQSPKRYGYVAPTRDQAKDIVWGYLKRFTHKIPGIKTNEAELTVTFPDGTTIRLYSGENYERMRGLYFDGVVIDEPEDIDPMAWTSVIRPCLTDYQGWAIWIGTVKGKKGQWKRLIDGMQDPEWFTLLLKASESGLIPADELASIERDAIRQNKHDIYLQEYECDPNIGIPGALFAKFCTNAEREGRIIDFPWDRSEPVWTFWDLGSPENTRCTYVQFVGREIHIIDHDADLSDPEMTPVKRVSHMQSKGYNFAGHFFPHDAAAIEKSGKNFQQQMSEAGLVNIQIIPKCREIWPGVNKLAELFPRLIFHKTNTEYLIQSLENYQRRIDKDGSVTDRILDNWACHSCFPAGTLIHTNRGHIPIEAVVVGDQVWTPVGWDIVTDSQCTGYSDTLRLIEVANRMVSATMNHPFFTDRGLVPAGELTESDSLWTSETDLSRLISMAPVTTLRDDITTRLQSIRVSATFTGTFGSSIMGQFQKVMKSITRIMTASTMTFPTWNSLRKALTGVFMLNLASGSNQAAPRNVYLSERSPQQEHGTLAQKARNGTGETGFPLMLSGKWSSRFASLAEKITRLRVTLKGLDFAPQLANNAPAMGLWEIKRNHVTNAESPTLGRSSHCIAHQSARIEQGLSLSVQSVEMQPVFNLTTEKHHCYFANGFLVSNCDSMRMLAEAMLNNMLRGHAEVIRQTRPNQYRQTRAKAGKYRG